MFWDDKDPNDVDAFAVNWATQLGNDTILTSVFSVAVGTVTISSQSNTTTTSTVWLAGGTPGELCQMLCRITTAAGRTLDRTTYLMIAEH